VRIPAAYPDLVYWHALAIAISDDTALHFVKLSPVTESKENPIRCLEIDDWAWCEGQNYGTILVDLDRHCVVDLLPIDPRMNYPIGWHNIQPST
jgi:transposase